MEERVKLSDEISLMPKRLVENDELDLILGLVVGYP